jgi:glycosyltransferase involved in cell wall biosynthesis
MTVELVSVVIPTLNAEATIADQLAALAAQDYEGEWELVIADNGSSDETKERALVWRRVIPQLEVVDALGPKCCAHPRNVGVAHARGNIILMCDADDVVEPSWIRGMVTGLASFDVVTGPLIETTLNRKWQYDFYESRPQTSVPVPYDYLPYVPGGNMGIHRGVFERLGGFDVRFGGAEDMDLGWRAVAEGYTLGFSPEAAIHYRLPKRARDLLLRRIRRCSYLPLLYKRHKADGMKREPLSRTAVAYASIFGMLAQVLTGRGAPYAVTYWGAERIGRILGSIRYRTLFI